MSNFVAQSTGVTASSTSITLSPPQTVLATQRLFVVLVGEDNPATQSVTAGPQGWQELVRFNGSRQYSIWTPVLRNVELRSSFTWTQNVAFPVTWQFLIYEPCSIAQAWSGTGLTPIGGTYDYFPAFSQAYNKVVAFAFSDQTSGSVDGITQRSFRALNLASGLRTGVYDAGPVTAGQQVGINTTGGGASSAVWLLLSLGAYVTPPLSAPFAQDQRRYTWRLRDASNNLETLPVTMPEAQEKQIAYSLIRIGNNAFDRTGDGLQAATTVRLRLRIAESPAGFTNNKTKLDAILTRAAVATSLELVDNSDGGATIYSQGLLTPYIEYLDETQDPEVAIEGVLTLARSRPHMTLGGSGTYYLDF